MTHISNRNIIITSNPNLKMMKWCFDTREVYFWLSTKSPRSTAKKVIKLRKQLSRLRDCDFRSYENVMCLSTLWIKNMKSTNDKTVFRNISDHIFESFYRTDETLPTNLTLGKVKHVLQPFDNSEQIEINLLTL